MSPGQRTRVVFLLVGLLASSFTAGPAVAHAVLLESSPASRGSVAGPDVPLKLRFNVRIDAARSRLTLILSDGSSRNLEIDNQTPPDLIYSHARGLNPGTYILRWQVLASDGHITRGEIPFTVVKA